MSRPVPLRLRLFAACAVASALSCQAMAGSVEPWAPANISSDRFESHAAFDPRNGDVYFVRSSPQFTGWRIVYSHCGPDGWSVAKESAFAGDGQEADPYFTRDGKTLWFISSRSVNGVPRKDLDIWRVQRDAQGAWGRPERLPEPVNSTAAEWFPRPAPDGWLYFGSGREGGQGKTDLWRARQDAQGAWSVENLGPNLNTTGDEYEPLVAPDGKRMVFMADGGLYESRLGADGRWGPRSKLGPEVNVDDTAIGAVFSPSGKSLLFSRDTKAPKSGEFFVWRITGESEDWPTHCPRPAR